MTLSEKLACRYDPKHGYLLRSHWPACKDNACEGCNSCPERHCTAREGCTGHLAPGIRFTCAKCIGRVRNNLAKIEGLAAVVLFEAQVQGVESEAANLAGPAANPGSQRARRAWQKRQAMAIPDEAKAAKALLAIEDTDPLHPYTVLGWWEMAIREDYHQHTSLGVTISRSRAYLDGILDTIAQDEDQDFAQFAREIATCCAHLEAVLHNSRAPERGAPCPLCPADEKGRKPRLVKRYDDEDKTGASDLWLCPNVEEHWWYEADYRLRIGGEFLAHAEALTAAQIEAQYAIPAATVYVWANRERIRKRGRDLSGRQLYDIADILDAREAVEAT